MTEKILFLTGRLAERSLHRVLESMQPAEFEYEVRQVGASVAALMTPTLIRKRLELPDGIDRILLPGRVRGELEPLAEHFGVPVERGPDELKDLPAFFGRAAMAEDLSRYDVRIFAEITEAPNLSLEEILAEAQRYAKDGADIIDVGCLPGVDFPHLADTVQMLKQEGFVVSVDSLETQDLLTGGQAGADFLLSLKPDSLWVAEEVEAMPVVIGDNPTDLDSLCACIEQCRKRDMPFHCGPHTGPHPFRLCEFGRPLRRIAAALSGHSDPDGNRQPDRTDPCRHRWHECFDVRIDLRAEHPIRADHSGQRALPDLVARGGPGPAHHARGGGPWNSTERH